MAGMVGVLHQLSTLAAQAHEIFDGLTAEAANSARRVTDLQERLGFATDRLAQEDAGAYPKPNAYMMGKPSPHAFREEIKKLDLPGGGHDPRTLYNGKPDFITAVGSFWPKNELKQPDVLATEPGEPPLRCALTENIHRGNSRTSWPPGGPKGAFANGPFGSEAALRSRGALSRAYKA